MGGTPILQMRTLRLLQAGLVTLGLALRICSAPFPAPLCRWVTGPCDYISGAFLPWVQLSWASGRQWLELGSQEKKRMGISAPTPAPRLLFACLIRLSSGCFPLLGSHLWSSGSLAARQPFPGFRELCSFLLSLLAEG